MSLTSIRLREAWNWGGLTFKELAVRTYRQIEKHETLDRAAAMAFYAMLSLIPFLGLFLAIGVGHRGRIDSQLLAVAHQLLPPEGAAIIEAQVRKMQANSALALLSFSTMVLLWSASSVFVGVMDATNAACGVRDSRPWWKRRLMAIALTLVSGVFLTGALFLIVAWPFVMGYLGLGAAAVWATLVRWVVVVVGLLATFAFAYYYGPDVKQEWQWITPGSALGVLVLIGASVGLRLYVEHGTSYSETYGALAGVILMLLWLNIASLALLVGAEVNCVIEHAAADGQDRGSNHKHGSKDAWERGGECGGLTAAEVCDT